MMNVLAKLLPPVKSEGSRERVLDISNASL